MQPLSDYIVVNDFWSPFKCYCQLHCHVFLEQRLKCVRQDKKQTGLYIHTGEVFGDKTSEEQDTVECNQQQNAVESKTRGEKIKISKKKNKTSKRHILKTPVNYIRTTN